MFIILIKSVVWCINSLFIGAILISKHVLKVIISLTNMAMNNKLRIIIQKSIRIVSWNRLVFLVKHLVRSNHLFSMIKVTGSSFSFVGDILIINRGDHTQWRSQTLWSYLVFYSSVVRIPVKRPDMIFFFIFYWLLIKWIKVSQILKILYFFHIASFFIFVNNLTALSYFISFIFSNISLIFI